MVIFLLHVFPWALCLAGIYRNPSMGMSTNKALVGIICLDNQYANENTFVIIVLFFMK